MRLNSVSINANAINASAFKRLRVSLEGTSVLETQVSISGLRKIKLCGDAIAVITSNLNGTANRFALANSVVFQIENTTEISPSVMRMGDGSAVIVKDTSLYYTKQVYGYGSAYISFNTSADVGVEFWSGRITIDELLTVTLDGSCVKRFGGDAISTYDIELAPSAIRRPSTGSVVAHEIILTELDPSSANGSVKYIGMFGDTIVAIVTEDSGMLRQAFLGSMDLSMLASVGSLTVKKQSLAGDAIISIVTEMPFTSVRRNGYGSVDLLTLAEGDCDIVVRADGSIVMSVKTDMTGYVRKFALEGECETTIDTSLDGTTCVQIYGDVELPIDTQCTGLALRVCNADCIIEALSFSSGVTNIDREDIDSHVFYKPEINRELIKPPIEREFYTER